MSKDAASDSGAEQSPARHSSLFERAMDALPDGVLLIDANRRVLYANQAFARHWGLPPSLLESRDDVRLLEFVGAQLADPMGFRQEVERLHSTVETSEDEIRFLDGRLFARRSIPFAFDGAFHARIWIFTDITEARRATIDTLTGLANRLAYSRDFPSYAAAADDGLFRSVAIVDVDNFKKFNDSRGHSAGDKALKQVASCLRSPLHNADDLLFRIGGEEFLLAIRTRTAAKAISLFEGMRREIAALAIAHDLNPPHGVVTASFGVGTFREAMKPAYVFERVDAAMYDAKALGRNTMVAFSF